jgi:alpha-L-fucosidase
MLPLGHWPVEVFQTLLAKDPRSPAYPSNPDRGLQIDPANLGDWCEVAPLSWNKRLTLMKCNRPVSGGTPNDYFLTLEEADSGRPLARFGTGYGLASALVFDQVLYVFASHFASNGWNDVTLFKSKDLSHWTSRVVLPQENEHLFNTSVARGRDGFVMAYETDDPKFTPFTIKFAASPDLEHWTRLPGVVFGADRYAACPCLRYASGYYYLLYLEHRTPRWFFETWLARSRDLKHWELSPANPLLAPGPADGVNASDPDLAEFGGKTYLYYSVGDQRTWSKLKRAVYPGPMAEFLAGRFTRP